VDSSADFASQSHFWVRELRLIQSGVNLKTIILLPGSPNLVILDEPCSGVDLRARKNIWELIESLRVGRSVVLATHYLDEAEQLSDKVLILRDVSIIF
jgi:ABC-type multidrug transport system ATPase subunit